MIDERPISHHLNLYGKFQPVRLIVLLCWCQLFMANQRFAAHCTGVPVSPVATLLPNAFQAIVSDINRADRSGVASLDL